MPAMTRIRPHRSISARVVASLRRRPLEDGCLIEQCGEISSVKTWRLRRAMGFEPRTLQRASLLREWTFRIDRRP